MARSLSDAANYVLNQFVCFGLEVPEGSRIRNMYSAVCNDDGSSRGLIPENDPNFDMAREALRDFSQLEFFFDQIRNEQQKAKYTPILNRIIGDSVLPQNDEKNSPGRDAQAEAFVFAVCKNARTNPLFEEPPDITCQVKGRKYGVAVKRIKNLSKIRTRLVKGARQMYESGLPGIISVELTIAVNPENYSIITNENEQKVRQWWIKKMRQITNRELEDVQNKKVRGIFLHEHCPVRFPDGQYSLRSMTYGISTAKNGKQEEEWEQFKVAFIKALPNLIM